MKDSYFAYNQTDFNTPDSMKIVLMMYDGTIDFLNKAIEYAEKGDIKRGNIYANWANDIIVELDNALNVEAGGEISRTLRMLYSFMNRHLIEASQQNDTQRLTKRLNDVIQMLSNLREGWQFVDHSTQRFGDEMYPETNQVMVQ